MVYFKIAESRKFNMSEKAKGLAISGLSSRFYDRFNNLFGFGESFSRRIIAEAALKPGESVLDCGCGTGTLAMIAKKIVGPKGRVHGIDISKDQLQIARKKGQKESLKIEYIEGSIDELPFPDASFDVVVSTLALHHVPFEIKKRAFSEMRRVLKPHGRMIIADFGWPAHAWGWIVFFPILLLFVFHSSGRDTLSHSLPATMKDAGINVSREYVLKQFIHLFKAS
jgi:ubiquinone/menaquinone biosynthesis C-methylase UbiE